MKPIKYYLTNLLTIQRFTGIQRFTESLKKSQKNLRRISEESQRKIL